MWHLRGDLCPGKWPHTKNMVGTRDYPRQCQSNGLTRVAVDRDYFWACNLQPRMSVVYISMIVCVCVHARVCVCVQVVELGFQPISCTQTKNTAGTRDYACLGYNISLPTCSSSSCVRFDTTKLPICVQWFFQHKISGEGWARKKRCNPYS